MIFTNMTLAIIMCLAYSISLSFIFFSKSNAKNEETKIYKVMIILNVIGLMLHLAAENVCYYYNQLPYVLSFIILKAMLTYYYLFGIVLLTYLVTVSKLPEKRKIQRVINIAAIVVPFSFLFMPIQVHSDMVKLAFYTYGLDCDITYYISAVVIIIMIGILLFQYKNISKKKILPLVLFVVGCTVSVSIQKKYPQITIVDLIEAIICCLMYFTIENPYENKNDSEPVKDESIEERYKRLREERMKQIEEEKAKALEEVKSESIETVNLDKPEEIAEVKVEEEIL